MAGQRQPVQFAPESQLQTLSRIAPGINALRGVQQQQQTQQQEMQRMMQRSAALDEMRRAIQDEDLGKYAQALINSGDQDLMQKGAQLQMADLQDKQFRRQYGGLTSNLTPEGMAELSGAGQKGLGLAKELGNYVVRPQPFAVGKNVYVPGQGFEPPPAAPDVAPQPQVLRRGDILVDPTTGERVASNVAQNALMAGAAPGAAPSAAPATQADGRSRYLQARGFEVGPDGAVRPIPGGPADPETIRRQTEARRASGAGAGIGVPVAGKPMSESDLARRRDAVAKEYRNAGTALQNLQETLNSAQQVRTAPGLERATGYSGKYLPSFPGGPAAQAETRLENLRGKITAMGKATAAMSGAIGSIANQEWKILADQIAVIDPVKGVEPMLEQIDSLEKQALAAMGRIKDAYEKQYGEDFERFPQFRELPMPAQGAGLNAPRTPPPARPAAPGRMPAQGGLTPAEQAELDALRRRFGRQQ
jgi:hypothetical protein